MTKRQKPDVGKNFERLVDIMTALRGPNGCLWDKEQTHESLTQFLLEETYEVLESISEENQSELQEELGDLLLQIVFHAQIARENKTFDINSVIDSINDKLIRRHPNVFGNQQIKSAKEQSVNWERIKKKEGKNSVLDGVPKALSALLRAQRIQQKASTVGFDWPVIEPVWMKISEEIDELREACASENKKRIEEEFGDLLFSLVNLSRFLSINPEQALQNTINKFIRRFQKIEDEFDGDEEKISKSSLQKLDKIWEEKKKDER